MSVDNSSAQPVGKDRAHALGRELIEVHDWLRGELSCVTAELDTYIAGGTQPTQLRAHCLAFCAALSRHYIGEDETAFPVLARQYPELAPVLEGLAQDHHLVADILRRLQALIETVDAGNAGTVQGELAGLAAILESHFQWEERRIVTALNELSGGSTGAELFGVNPPH
ncbi:hemerythrin domain-containing protein [Nocardia sp. SYP-A9097]|uniref:hemerythrin domain-containing protein n=1 Tax=Nocardia sp. SYP-A9097 TaxID=2663237 RepID=UPI00129B375F|nr:hemerythrin domain-containing protein [Nocardia sp. SYP-A9097]MRH87296.1 hemerythrin domain-containing protein [Nocardia sp. SYP-A9097]